MVGPKDGQVQPPPQGHLESFWGPQEGPPPSPAQVQEEFKQNMENIGVETLLRNFAESKGTGCHPPGERPRHPWAAFGGLCSCPRALPAGPSEPRGPLQ